MDNPERIGMSAKESESFNLKGILFKENRDFVVEEIMEDGKVLTVEMTDSTQNESLERKNFLTFTLVKEGISTFEALNILSRATHTSIKRFGYLGSKDKRALTAQRISVFRGEVSTFKNMSKTNLFLKDFAYSDSGCMIGKLYGNKFTVRIRDFEGSDEELERFRKEVGKGIPNFYGSQRFGGSALNINISRQIFKRDFKDAIFTMVLKDREEDPLSKEARSSLRDIFSGYVLEDKDINREEAVKALEELPPRLYTEKKILQRLLDVRHDYIGALRLVPKYLRLLILQSLQYYIFNRTLSEIILKGIKVEKIPTIGYDLDLNAVDGDIAKIIESILREENLSLEMLKINEMQEVSLKTFERDTMIYTEDLAFKREGNDLIVSFKLKKGAYATVLLSNMLNKEISKD
ncbi:tRNA pseudouridine(13) synthase TruD [Candidatus Parvarchaeota archaeon]|uniref:tRNA pseudouridine(13) synthase TruD n=1 Tax=Candidatus Acidifodinimicrobium mancum TaxID=2898728 RepID=A0A8T3US01_9ARCH|nr:tRNA pseudouridine(13) synthase TruD [Candidatus Acidifodinimicrobium mancum]